MSEQTPADYPRGSNVAIAERQIVDSSHRVYDERAERVAMRCALGDAAALCDAIARDLADENRKRGGGVTKLGVLLALVATRCGNAIWAMRDKIEVVDRKCLPRTKQESPYELPQ